MADIVDDFLQRLSQAIPDASPEIRYQIETSIRQSWGGAKPYVAKRVGLSTRKALIGHALRQARPLAEVFAQAGVSRRTGYRILASK